ncbi:MAG TPA: M17 family peptidase N-terminal domain-containing protein, partial [Anaerolineaceae bacterium]|nr:M17 family peptidase N-terminal domain-containing protein [Anaerolineaceae bacterium]
MTETFFEIQMPVTLKNASSQDPAAPARIEVRTAPQQPILGEPGKKVGDITQFTAPDGQLVLLVSLGAADKLNVESFRRAGGYCAQWLIKHPSDQIDLPVEQFSAFSLPGSLRAFLEGLRLGSFRYDRRKKTASPHPEMTVLLRGADRDHGKLVCEV